MKDFSQHFQQVIDEPVRQHLCKLFDEAEEAFKGGDPDEVATHYCRGAYDLLKHMLDAAPRPSFDVDAYTQIPEPDEEHAGSFDLDDPDEDDLSDEDLDGE